MPDAVFDACFGPLSEPYGKLPSSSAADSVIGTRWEKFFDETPIDEWAQLHWKLRVFPFHPDHFHPCSNLRAKWILEHVAFGFNTPTANIRDSTERLRACAAFIRDNRAFPSPLVAIQTADGLNIADGHHRLAAAIYLTILDGYPVSVWVGRHV